MSKDTRVQYEALIQTMVFFIFYWAMAIMAFDDDKEELIEYLDTIFFYFFTFVIIYFFYKHSVHYFSFLEATCHSTFISNSPLPFPYFAIEWLARRSDLTHWLYHNCTNLWPVRRCPLCGGQFRKAVLRDRGGSRGAPRVWAVSASAHNFPLADRISQAGPPSFATGPPFSLGWRRWPRMSFRRCSHLFTLSCKGR